MNVLSALLRLITVTVFNFTHPPVLLHIPRTRLSPVGCRVFSHGFRPLSMPGLTSFSSDRHPLWAPSHRTSGRFFLQNESPAILSVLPPLLVFVVRLS